MATVVAPPPRLDRRAEHLFFQLWTFAALALIVAGFAPTWFGRAWLGTPQMLPLTPLVWLHGLLFTAWLAVFATQVTLVATDRRRVHMALGRAALVFMVALPTVAFFAALHGAARHAGPPVFAADQFLLLPLAGVPAIAWLVWMGWRNRFDAHVHKRMMAFTTAVLIQPGSARFLPGPIGLLLIPVVFVLAILLFDLTTARRVRPLVLAGALVVLATTQLPPLLWASPAWLAVSHRLMGWWAGL